MASPALPAAWSDGVKALAEKIAAAMKPSRTVSLEFKNISSLGGSEVEAVRVGLEKELTGRGLQLGSSGVAVEVTLSENVEGYIWVAQLHGDDEQRTAIVSVAKVMPDSATNEKESLTLSRELVWRQPNRFLDFAVFYRLAGVTYSTLVILEPDRLTYLRSATDSEWRPWTTLVFPKAKSRRRDAGEEIGFTPQGVTAEGVRCTGLVEEPAKLDCIASSGPKLKGYTINPKFSGRNPEDESGLLNDRCGGKMIGIASGDGDWTQPDSLQGFLITDLLAEGIPSGSAIDFDGPVTAIRGGGGDNLRVVVHNLKAGNYEAYVVTATCNH